MDQQQQQQDAFLQLLDETLAKWEKYWEAASAPDDLIIDAAHSKYISYLRNSHTTEELQKNEQHLRNRLAHHFPQIKHLLPVILLEQDEAERAISQEDNETHISHDKKKDDQGANYYNFEEKTITLNITENLTSYYYEYARKVNEEYMTNNSPAEIHFVSEFLNCLNLSSLSIDELTELRYIFRRLRHLVKEWKREASSTLLSSIHRDADIFKKLLASIVASSNDTDEEEQDDEEKEELLNSITMTLLYITDRYSKIRNMTSSTIMHQFIMALFLAPLSAFQVDENFEIPNKFGEEPLSPSFIFAAPEKIGGALRELADIVGRRKFNEAYDVRQSKSKKLSPLYFPWFVGNVDSENPQSRRKIKLMMGSIQSKIKSLTKLLPEFSDAIAESDKIQSPLLIGLDIEHHHPNNQNDDVSNDDNSGNVSLHFSLMTTRKGAERVKKPEDDDSDDARRRDNDIFVFHQFPRIDLRSPDDFLKALRVVRFLKKQATLFFEQAENSLISDDTIEQKAADKNASPIKHSYQLLMKRFQKYTHSWKSDLILGKGELYDFMSDHPFVDVNDIQDSVLIRESKRSVIYSGVLNGEPVVYKLYLIENSLYTDVNKATVRKLWKNEAGLCAEITTLSFLPHSKGISNIRGLIQIPGDEKESYLGFIMTQLENDKEWAPASFGELAFFMRSLLEVVSECHQAGIYHNDIKRGNMLIDITSQAVYLIDFEMATIISPNLPIQAAKYRGGTRSHALEKIGDLHGTIQDDASTDLYAIAILLFQLMFDVAESPSIEMMKSLINANLPPDFEIIVDWTKQHNFPNMEVTFFHPTIWSLFMYLATPYGGTSQKSNSRNMKSKTAEEALRHEFFSIMSPSPLIHSILIDTAGE